MSTPYNTIVPQVHTPTYDDYTAGILPASWNKDIPYFVIDPKKDRNYNQNMFNQKSPKFLLPDDDNYTSNVVKSLPHLHTEFIRDGMYEELKKNPKINTILTEMESNGKSKKYNDNWWTVYLDWEEDNELAKFLSKTFRSHKHRHRKKDWPSYCDIIDNIGWHNATPEHDVIHNSGASIKSIQATDVNECIKECNSDKDCVTINYQPKFLVDYENVSNPDYSKPLADKVNCSLLRKMDTGNESVQQKLANNDTSSWWWATKCNKVWAPPNTRSGYSPKDYHTHPHIRSRNSIEKILRPVFYFSKQGESQVDSDHVTLYTSKTSSTNNPNDSNIIGFGLKDYVTGLDYYYNMEPVIIPFMKKQVGNDIVNDLENFPYSYAAFIFNGLLEQTVLGLKQNENPESHLTLLSIDDGGVYYKPLAESITGMVIIGHQNDDIRNLFGVSVSSNDPGVDDNFLVGQFMNELQEAVRSGKYDPDSVNTDEPFINRHKRLLNEYF